MTPRFGYGAADGLLYPVCEMSVEANLNESVSLAQADTVYHAPRVFWELLSRKKKCVGGKETPLPLRVVRYGSWLLLRLISVTSRAELSPPHWC